MIVFGYNFHHRKTQDFLFYCDHYGYEVEAVLAASWRDLGYPPTQLRTRVRTGGTIHPAEICSAKGIPFHVVEHNSGEALEILDQLDPEIGLIAGARILSAEVIQRFKKGIINFHMGLIPEMRGLDSVQWAIYKGLPLGITSHLIDERVDAGRIVERHILPEYADDTLLDLSERLHQWQLERFSDTIDAVVDQDCEDFVIAQWSECPPHGPFPPEYESEMLIRFNERFPDSILGAT
jgi:phosphoribosylglycinamide formyltransferase-1